MLLLLLGCSAQLISDALVIPGRAPAELFEGPPGFGSSLAWVHGSLAIGGGGALRWRDQRWETGAIKGLWQCRDGPCVADGERILDLVNGLELGRVPGLRHAHGDAQGWLAATPEQVVGSEQSWPLEQALKVLLADHSYVLACPDTGCVVQELSPDGGAEFGVEELGVATRGGALTEHLGELVWGAPDLETQGATGALRGQGWIIEGAPGEHLGQALCPGFGAGEHNLLTVPNMSRVRSLDGLTDLALEAGAEGGYMVLACGSDGVAVAQPSYGTQGRVWVLQGWP